MVYTSTDFQSVAQFAEFARNKMHEGVVRIKFIKVNGESRSAIATTSWGVVGNVTKSHKYWFDDDHTPFFDLNIGRWRSYCNDRLVSVEPLGDYED